MEHTFDNLWFEDLRLKYQAHRPYTISGTGRNRVTGYKDYIVCPAGELEQEEWITAVKEVIARAGEETLQEQLLAFVQEHCPWQRKKADQILYALELHSCRIFDNPLWVQFVQFNSQYRPEVLASTPTRTIVTKCCGLPGLVTEALAEKYKGQMPCPHCGRWATIECINKEKDPEDYYV